MHILGTDFSVLAGVIIERKHYHIHYIRNQFSLAHRNSDSSRFVLSRSVFEQKPLLFSLVHGLWTTPVVTSYWWKYGVKSICSNVLFFYQLKMFSGDRERVHWEQMG